MTRQELAKLITKLESSREDLFEEGLFELEKFAKKTPSALRIGICGSPGAGKSSLIECLGLELLKRGKKLAILAIDPTSPVTGGSILGDKTRMPQLAVRDDVFIRPSPSKMAIGGIAEATDDVALALEAAGFNLILFETVGIGQAEYSVADVVDIIVYVHLPQSGDELQGSKKGILELSDAVCIHKADLNETAANLAKSELERAFHFGLSDNYASTKFFLTSAVTEIGIKDLAEFLCVERDFTEKRKAREKTKWEKLWRKEVLRHFSKNSKFQSLLQDCDSALKTRRAINDFLK